MPELYHSDISNLPAAVGHRLILSLPGLSFGKSLFIDTIDCTANTCVAIFEGPGGKYNPLAGANRRTLVLQARATTASEARKLIWDVFRDLQQSEDNLLILGENKYPYMFQDTPHKIGKDEKGRITFQFMMHIIYH